jgi:hypothetical protein
MSITELAVQRIISIIIGVSIALITFFITITNWQRHQGRLVGFIGLLAGWSIVLLLVILRLVPATTAINQAVWVCGGFILAALFSILRDEQRERIEEKEGTREW